MKHLQFLVTDPSLLEHAMNFLNLKGLEHLYTLEDSSTSRTIIGGFSAGIFEVPEYLHLHLNEEATIDWNAQWEAFSPYANTEGEIICSLKDFGGPDIPLQLIPGAGFGDISHPTTQLMLQMMCTRSYSFVVDIGCGSGVLSCAAALLGAENVYGYDIDPLAVEHAEKNVALNKVQAQAKIGIDPIPVLDNATLLLNMTLAEQKMALAQLQMTNCLFLVSGIHEENLPAFHKFRSDLGLKVEEQYMLENWHSFIMT